jgi:hypothetical protein
MNKIIGYLLLIMTTFCSNAQNKKEQIEALNFSIYSLKNVLSTAILIYSDSLDKERTNS